jgi:hypothetical protein
LVCGALQVVGALVVVVNGGAGAAVVGLAVGVIGGAGGAGAGVAAVVAGPGCSFCGDWLVAPPTTTTVATMIMNAARMVAPIIVRPVGVEPRCGLRLCVSVRHWLTSPLRISESYDVRPMLAIRSERATQARIRRSSVVGSQDLSRPGKAGR